MFSDRTQWNLQENELSRRIAARKHAGLPIFDLTETNPTRCGFDFAENEIRAALAQPSVLSYKPDPKGWLPAREAVVAYYREKNVNVSSEQIVLTASTSEAYSFVLRLLANAEDNILVPAPSYPLFDFLATLNDVELRPYRLDDHHGWRIDFDSLRAAVSDRTRAVLTVNPNNPTGSFLPRAELPALIEFCRAHQLALISDEVFSDFSFHAPEISNRSGDIVPCLLEEGEVLRFVLNGISKMLALPQMKLAWIAAGGPKGILDSAMARLEVIADTYLSVNTPIQHALPSLLARSHRAAIQSQIRARIVANRTFLERALAKNDSVRLLCSEGGWSAVLKISETLSEETLALQLLEKQEVLVHPGYFFDFPSEGFLVVSLLPPAETFQTGVNRMVEFLRSR